MIENKVLEIMEKSTDGFAVMNKIISRYVGELDSLMKEISDKQLSEISFDLVGDYYSKLSERLYFVNASVKKLELENKAALRTKQEVYNQAVLSIKEDSIITASKKTQTDIAAEASEIAKEDVIVSDIFDVALSSVTDRIKDAWNMVSTLKHRYNAMVQEMQSESYAKNMRAMANQDVRGEN